ncbi:MAG: 3'-5' exonuclease [Solobacterium sp.]|nr:3'-5' exonuclease [Solobacterium sp.]
MTRVTAIDFETANSSPASVCAVGISVMEDGAVEEKYYSLIRPAENVSRFFNINIQIHGIRPEDVEDAPTFREVFTDIYPYLKDSVVCAHNARFDMGCMKAACENVGIRVPHLKYFDTVALSRRMCPELPHHRLNDMCGYLDIELNHHNAASDASGCLMIVAHAMNRAGCYEIEELLGKFGVRVNYLY